MKKTMIVCLIALTTAVASGALAVEMVTQEPVMKMTTPIPKNVTTPDKVESPIGTLEYFDGIPIGDTTERVYDYVDRARAVDAFIRMTPGVSMYHIRQGQRDLGHTKCNQIVIAEEMGDSKPLVLTWNNTSLYTWGFLDLKADGPTVIEIPPDVLGILDDMYFRYITDMGAAGPDKGQGGKYLILPPDYDGEVPEGYYVFKSQTYGVWNFMRGYVRDSVEAAAKNIKDNLKVYPLSRKDNPPPMEFKNMSGLAGYNTVMPNDYSFFESLNALIQEEPIGFIDPETRGILASLGIVKGKAFEPDARMKKLLTEAAAIGNAYARANTVFPRDPGHRYYPDTGSEWVMAFPDNDSYFLKDGARRIDGRLWMHYNAVCVTPAMALTKPGAGSQYAIAGLDAEHRPLDGAKTYQMHLPPNFPVKDNWSVTIYDTQTRSMMQTDQQFAGINSLSGKVKENSDGSIDVVFAPEAPAGMEDNWVQTIPGKSWFIILRAYGPLAPWIDKTWRPGEIEEMTAGLVGTALAAPPTMKMTTDIPESITAPDKVETSIGTLNYFDGVPTEATTKTVYDYLDRSRAVEAFLNCIPVMSMYGIREGQREFGLDSCNKVVIYDNLLDSKALWLTANTSTMYAMGWLDLKKDGPTVVDLPPRMLGILDDAAFLYMTDLGMAGPDKGKGGKFLVLPPGYDGDVPDGYFVVRSKTYGAWLFMRGYLDKGVEAASKNIRDNLKVYPLAKKDNQPPMQFINGTGKEIQTVLPNDFSFFKNVHAILQEEPAGFLGAEISGQLAAIGIEQGKPFPSDKRMVAILKDAADIGNAAARAISFAPRHPGLYTYGKNSGWCQPIIGGSTTYMSNGARVLDGRVFYHFGYICVSPAMSSKSAGKGSDYSMGMVDSKGQPLDGSKTYKLHLPPNIPVADFWALTMYDTQTRCQLQTDQQFPTLDSYAKGMKTNADGSIDVYFSPKAPMGQESNWLQTIPGKSWFVALRMYGPLEAWLDQTWRPGEIELVK